MTFKKTLACSALLFHINFSGCAENDLANQKALTELGGNSLNPVTRDIIVNAENDGWRSHGRTYAEERYSPLTQINTDSIGDLGLHWSFDLGTSRGIEATPIVHDGIIYVTSTWNKIDALDAKTGEAIWSLDPQIDKEQAAKGCCDVINRGVAIWGDSIFTGTMDGRLISANAKTGVINWDVNTIDKSKPYTISGAPRIIDGKVIIGNGGAELGVRGYVSAYDSETGELLWRFYTVPGNPENGFENEAMKSAAETWTGEFWKAGGGGTVWDSMAYDEELDLLYIGVGNGSPWNHRLRSPDGGDNLFLSSIVALRPDTGEYVWHYQTTPAETWDYTAAQHMILTDLKIDGKTRKVIMQAPKNGFFYVLDRETGEFISANNFVPVTWATHIDPNTGRPVETESARYSGPNQKPQLPGPLGAHNWQPMSYSETTGLVYIPAQEAPFLYTDKANYEYKEGIWNTGVDFAPNSFPNDKAFFKAVRASLKGRLIAWDPKKQESVWSYEHKGPWNGGVLSTQGGLVFQGSADAHFKAFDASTGALLWRFFAQTGIVAAPVTYQIDGVQYVAVASGWGGSFVLSHGGILPTGSTANVGRLMVFKLGGNATLPDLPTPEIVKKEPPKLLDVTDEVVHKGSKAYANLCLVCHGDQGFSSGLVPNLRYSPFTISPQAWEAAVLNGALSSRGMPNFGKSLDKSTAEAIRAYIIFEANKGLSEEFYSELIPAVD